jgi:hypothetical protein
LHGLQQNCHPTVVPRVHPSLFQPRQKLQSRWVPGSSRVAWPLKAIGPDATHSTMTACPPDPVVGTHRVGDSQQSNQLVACSLCIPRIREPLPLPLSLVSSYHFTPYLQPSAAAVILNQSKISEQPGTTCTMLGTTRNQSPVLTSQTELTAPIHTSLAAIGSPPRKGRNQSRFPKEFLKD